MRRSTRDLIGVLVALAAVTAVLTAPAPASAVPWRGTLLSDAITSWWARPNSVFQPAHGITYMTGVSSAGDWVWGAYDHKSGVMTRRVLGTLRRDDHDTPAIMAPTDRPPVVFYTGHNVRDTIWYRVSAQIGDWQPGPEHSIKMPGSVTYVQVHRGRTADTLLLLTRCGDQWLIAVSADYGKTWRIKPLVRFDAGAYGYLVTTQLADGTIRIAAAGHPERTNLSEVRYTEVSPAGDVHTEGAAGVANIYTGAGLPLIVSRDMPVIYDFPEGKRARLFDVSTAPVPEIVIAEWQGDAVAEYVYLERGDGGWSPTTLVPTGRPIGYTFATRYVGGATFPNPTQGGDLYLSRETSDQWRVERWRRDAVAGLWGSELIAADSKTLARPSPPVGASPQLPLLWLRLTKYDDYQHFSGSTVGLLPEGRPGPRAAGVAVAGDWDGDGKAEPGVFRGGKWTIRTGGTTVSFTFGRWGDVPVVGDWDGDGKDTVALRRGREWIFSDTVAPATTSARFNYGLSGDAAVAGDWDGDGVDGVGVRRGALWYLKNDPAAGGTDLRFSFGRTGDVPVTGDWNGDGRDGVGVRRGDTWMLRDDATAGAAQTTFRFGQSSDTPVVADWGGLGKDSPGVRRGDTGIWYIIDTAPGVPRSGYAPNRFLF